MPTTSAVGAGHSDAANRSTGATRALFAGQFCLRSYGRGPCGAGAACAPRLQRIAMEIVKVTRQPSSAYLFTTADRIHPTRIRPGWKELTSVSWTRRQVVNRMVELPEQLRFTAHPLWHNP